MSILQDVQFYDKYSRFDYDLNRRENWVDTVNRVTQYLLSFDKNLSISQDVREELFTAMYNKDVMPSMRNMAMAGKAAERSNICSYNCAFSALDNLYAFKEAVLILMSGTGLGYSVEKIHTDKLPKLTPNNNKILKIAVDDTTEGWADAIYYSITYWIQGYSVEFDFSKIRPAGAILKTKGGRASGSTVLRESLKNIHTVIENRRSEGFLRPIDVHDIMCHIARCIVSGGVRRSAMICLFDKNDHEMMTCKNPGNIEDNPQRYLSNNSAVFSEKLSYQELSAFMNTMFDGMSGEPGIFSRYAIKQTLPERRNYKENFGTNPSLRAGTRVFTTEGIYKIEELQDKDIMVSNMFGRISPAKCFLSGKNQPLYKITLYGNHKTIYATKEHLWPVYIDKYSVKKVPTDQLKYKNRIPIPPKRTSLDFGTEGNYDEGFLAGWIIGNSKRNDDGNIILILTPDDYFTRVIQQRLQQVLPNLSKDDVVKHEFRTMSWYEITLSPEITSKFSGFDRDKSLPDAVFNTYCDDFRKGLVDGIYSSSAYIEKSTVGISLYNRKLLEDISELLGFYGINNRVIKRNHHHADIQADLSYYLLHLNRPEDITHFVNVFALSNVRKQGKLELHKKVKTPRFRTVEIMSVELTNLTEDVWDISVFDDTHTFQLSHCITGNCGEIILRPNQFCNLSSVVCRENDTLDQLKNKVKLATIIGTLQSMSDYFPGLRGDWYKNQVEERLLGVDLNGIMDCAIIRDREVLTELQNYAIEVNRYYSNLLGINHSTAITCVKPSGNSSVLLDTSPGLHARWSDYYIRRVQLHKSNPILQVLNFYGIPTVASNYLPDTFVAEFPVKSPTGAITGNSWSAIEQLENWKQFKLYWTEHNPSCTISYLPHEQEDITDWLYENQNIICGLSFLPKLDAVYEQMPYEAISEEKYNELMRDFPVEIDWQTLHSLENGLDNTSAAQTAACEGDKCLL